MSTIPVLTTTCGKRIGQTASIIRYVADELKLFGKNTVERALIDTTIVCNKEIEDTSIQMFNAQTDKDKVINV